MGKSAWEYYGVKLIFQATITGDPIPERIDENYSDTHTFYEESIRLVHAQSFDHAYSIAERMGLAYKDEYINVYGQTVTWELVEAINCYRVGDKIANSEEVFSSISPRQKEITPSKYLMQQYDYHLEDDDWNDARKEEDLRLQTALHFEQFSKWRKED